MDCRCTHMRCVLQSEEYAETQAEMATSLDTKETTQFMDNSMGVSVGESVSAQEHDLADMVESASLSAFLSRPVRIANFTWSESDAVGVKTSFNPWSAYFSNANIAYKLNNFSFLRCDLKLKFIINASQFYYGSMRACYQPLPVLTPSTVIAASGTELIPYSQQPGIWLKPQTSEGGEMTLPFFLHKNYLRVQVLSDFTNMGTMRMIIYNALQSANGVSTSGATVQVFAWAENVHIGGPSLGLALQSDEYEENGPISGPASTVARIAGMVKGIPIIGKFATATEMGAKAVSGIAKLFGFTNVPVIAEAQPFRPTPFPQLANPEIGYPTEKLTLDSKNELTIDPTAVGLPPQDELAIEYFATKQTYLTSATWSTSTVVDTPLFTSRVTPLMFAKSGLVVQNTPQSILTQCFNNWRGDLIFTFRFVASPFHKGRVRISYDPVFSGIQTTGDTGAVAFNTIVDLGKETEVDVKIPYQQALAWLRCSSNLTAANQPWSTSTTPTLTYLDGEDNGILSVKVLTLLTAPEATSAIYMQVFVRGADNLEFANPGVPNQLISPFALQCDEYSETRKGDDVTVGENDSTIIVQRNRVNFGEEIRSLRVLLRRSNLVDVLVPFGTTASLSQAWFQQFRFPPHFGFDPNGLYTANGITVPGSTFPMNYNKVLPWHLISMCFVAHRGSAHWHYNNHGPNTSLAVVRNNYVGVTTTSKGITSLAATTASQAARYYVTQYASTGGGIAITNQSTQAGLSVSMPNYTQYKFQSTTPTRGTLAPAAGATNDDGSTWESFYIQADGAAANLPTGFRIQRYFSVGTDYNLHFFLNAPSLYLYTSVPPTP